MPLGGYQVNQDVLKLNGTLLLLVYVDDVNKLGRSVHTFQKNTETLVGVCKEIGLEVNADKTKNMVSSQVQDEFTIYRLIIVPMMVWKSSNIKIFGNNLIKSKFYPGRN